MVENRSVSPRSIRRAVIEQSKRAGVGHIGSALSIADIIAAVDTEKSTSSLEQGKEGLSSEKLWNDLSAQIYDYLRGIKLSQFVKNASAEGEPGESVSHSWKPEVTYHSRA